MTYHELLKKARTALSSRLPQEEAESDARVLLEECTGWSSAQYLLHAQEQTDAGLEEQYFSCVKRRLSGEPTAYITGHTGFMGLDFTVSPDVLIPNQDTETLAETALGYILDHFRPSDPLTILDLCAGSGCIGISLGVLLREKGYSPRIDLADISRPALEAARKNADAFALTRTRFLICDLFDAIDRPYDILVCNPPYVPAGEVSTLEKNVLYQPRMAMDGGEDGLFFYRRICPELGEYVQRAFFLEVGEGEAEKVEKMTAPEQFAVSSVQDYRGVLRVVQGERKVHV